MSDSSFHEHVHGDAPVDPDAGKSRAYVDTSGNHQIISNVSGDIGTRRQDWDPPVDLVDSVSGRIPSWFTNVGGYTSPTGLNSNVIILAADRPLESSIWLPYGAVVDRVQYRVFTAGTTNPTAFIGIYSEDGQTLLRAIDDLDWTSTGQKETSFTEVTIAPGMVHIVANAVDAGVALYGIPGPGIPCVWHGSSGGTIGAGTTAAPATRTVPTGYQDARRWMFAFRKDGT